MLRKKTFKKTYLKRNFFWGKLFVSLFLVLLFLGVFFFTLFIKDLPRPEKFNEGVIIQSTKIYDRDGKEILYEISGEEKRTVISLEEAPEFLKMAIISTEDKDFLKHKGIDIKSIIRAVLYDLKIKKPVQGASTITQQLIRSYFLTTKKTLKRKTREVILSLELERRYSKEQILEWYLNLIPFGSNIYGVEEACQMFFKKTTSDISLPEAAAIAALIQAPSYFSPYGDNKDDLLKRKDYVIDRMVKLGHISKEEGEKVKKEEIVFQPKTNLIQAPHFVFLVKDYLEKKYGRDYLNREGLKVYTTLDFDIQKKAEEIIKEGIEKIKIYNVHNGALVSINPKTGEILAMVGSKDYFASPEPDNCQPGINCLFDPQVNICLSLRQPGSAIKPFIYAKSFQEGFTPNSIVWDVKTEFNVNCSPSANEEYGFNNSECYHPQNYTGNFIGPISLRSALAQSRNLPSVKVLYLAGLSSVLDFIQSFGISSLTEKGRYGLSLVLGGGEVRLLEMVEGYSVFSNNGVKNPLSFIKKIENSKGEVVEESKINPLRILSSQIAEEINSILSDNEARAPMFGVNSYLNLRDYESAAKTGTTQDYRDAWIIGYTPTLVTGVWVGNNNNDSMVKNPSVILTGPIWKEFMESVLPSFPKESFVKPKERISDVPILNGILESNHSILYFLNKKDPQYPLWEEGVRNWLGY